MKEAIKHNIETGLEIVWEAIACRLVEKYYADCQRACVEDTWYFGDSTTEEILKAFSSDGTWVGCKDNKLFIGDGCGGYATYYYFGETVDLLKERLSA